MDQSNRKHDKTRNAMLAKVHIAPVQLGISDEDRRDIIEAIGGPGKRSSKQLNNKQLSKLIKHYVDRGWKPKGKKPVNQVDALQEKADKMLKEAAGLGFVRHPRKLVLSILGVSDIKFCKDASKLKKLLTILQRVE